MRKSITQFLGLCYKLLQLHCSDGPTNNAICCISEHIRPRFSCLVRMRFHTCESGSDQTEKSEALIICFCASKCFLCRQIPHDGRETLVLLNLRCDQEFLCGACFRNFTSRLGLFLDAVRIQELAFGLKQTKSNQTQAGLKLVLLLTLVTIPFVPMSISPAHRTLTPVQTGLQMAAVPQSLTWCGTVHGSSAFSGNPL